MHSIDCADEKVGGGKPGGGGGGGGGGGKGGKTASTLITTCQPYHDKAAVQLASADENRWCCNCCLDWPDLLDRSQRAKQMVSRCVFFSPQAKLA